MLHLAEDGNLKLDEMLHSVELFAAQVAPVLQLAFKK
jgi:hypothetical protein